MFVSETIDSCKPWLEKIHWLYQITFTDSWATRMFLLENCENGRWQKVAKLKANLIRPFIRNFRFWRIEEATVLPWKIVLYFPARCQLKPRALHSCGKSVYLTPSNELFDNCGIAGNWTRAVKIGEKLAANFRKKLCSNITPQMSLHDMKNEGNFFDLY